ncbi:MULTISPECIES: hypothetical protein [Megasphaera]|jgi:hypothetical protein|uniref:Uncharacterized protein n=1 Tax=Megasphaera hexanoica TaxID=1675036 RepID=A0A848BWE6_9FIRM|nr:MULTISPECIES: hypothetical protein [Megasphaera]NME29138.1 hypothetical protein [Megasphaera hexanoica]
MSRKNKLKRNRRSITVQFTNPECRVMFNVMECLVSDVYEVGVDIPAIIASVTNSGYEKLKNYNLTDNMPDGIGEFPLTVKEMCGALYSCNWVLEDYDDDLLPNSREEISALRDKLDNYLSQILAISSDSV